eukprot:TRINITY_DN68086_c1_g3_i1.p1 TRINITY_DN68086_c1_g3~~TRINITY_DN68086_c1_g3_i1.p1  ORF type:complete len:223 (+),score=7.61 TRINITY_DN68086_c1_g3_i1:43-669(+)
MLGLAVLAACVISRKSRRSSADGPLHKDDSPTPVLDPTSTWKKIPANCVASGCEMWAGPTDQVVTATGKPLMGYAEWKISSTSTTLDTNYFGLFTNNESQTPAVAYCCSSGEVEYRGENDECSTVVATLGKNTEVGFTVNHEGVSLRVGEEELLFPELQPPPGCAFAPMVVAVSCPAPLTVTLDISDFIRLPRLNARKARGRRGKRGQ